MGGHSKQESPFTIAPAMPGVLPEGKTASGLALDWGLNDAADYGAMFDGLGPGPGQRWLGWPRLAQLAQQPEYRRAAEILAKEMVRKWIVLTATGAEDKNDRITHLGAALDRFRVREAFASLAQLDGLFGGAHLYLDTGHTEDADELQTPLILDSAKIGKGGLKRLTVIEPMWAYPATYNSRDPLAKDFYAPTTWYVQGRPIHSSRLLTFVGREVPDILKPAYSFRGLSLTQMGLPYVSNWIRTRDNVGDLVENFSTMVLKTDMGDILQGGAGELLDLRAQLYATLHTNRGLFVCQAEGEGVVAEDLSNVAVPLAGLDHLQAQAQEHMASIWGIPLVKLFGVQPSGLNASSEGEIRVYYDWVHAQQEHLMARHLRTVLHAIMLSEWGEIDAEIDFRFEPLWQMDEAALATIRKTNADTAAVYSEIGVLGPEDERNRLAAEDGGLYNGLDPNDLPDPPENDPAAENLLDEESPDDDRAAEQAMRGAQDARFEEKDHPRDEDGKFGPGGGGGATRGIRRPFDRPSLGGLRGETRRSAQNALDLADAALDKVDLSTLNRLAVGGSKALRPVRNYLVQARSLAASHVAGMSDQEFTDVFGVDVGNRDGKRSTVTQVRNGAACLPDTHRAFLAQAGVKFTACDVLEVDLPTLGWFVRNPGSPGEIEVASYVIEDGQRLASSDADQTTAHEAAHALDSHFSGAFSEDGEFAAAFAAAQDRMSRSERDLALYFVGSPQEQLSECYAALYAPRRSDVTLFSSMSQDRAAAVFAHPCAVLRKLLARKGLSDE